MFTRKRVAGYLTGIVIFSFFGAIVGLGLGPVFSNHNRIEKGSLVTTESSVHRITAKEAEASRDNGHQVVIFWLTGGFVIFPLLYMFAFREHTDDRRGRADRRKAQ